MKNRHFLLVVFLFMFSASMIAQNKIGDNPTTIQAGSLLELESLTKGLRLPRVPLNDVTKWTLDGTPVSGMVVYNDAGTEPKGLYYWSIELTKWVQVQNTADLSLLIANKVDKVAGKDLSTNDYTTADKDKLAAITGINTGDQDLTPYAMTTVVNNSLALKEDLANKSIDVVTDAASTTKYPAVKAIKDYVDVAVAGATIADANVSTKGKIQLAGDLGGSAAAPTVPGLALKEDASNKSTDVLTDAASTTKYPAVKAIKDYVDVAVAGATIADANVSTKGKIQLAGDLGGTAAAPTVPGLTQKVDKTITVNGQTLSANVTLTKTDVGLSNVDNTSDVNKPISTATQTALDTKEVSVTAGTTAQYYRGDKTWTTLDKIAVGLANVDNTTDAAKPISTLTQTALDLKAPLASPALTGTPTAPTAATLTNNTEIANTAFVTSAVAAAAVVDADASTKGKIQLAGDLSGTAANPTIAANAVTTLKITDGAVTTAKIEGLADGKIIVGVNGTSAGNTQVAVTGDVTMLNTGATTIANNAVTTAKINDDAVTTVKLERLPYGQIIVGAYPAANVVVPVTGDVTMLNTGVTKVEKIQNVAVSSTAPTTAGQLLSYDGTLWAPANVSNGLTGNATDVKLGGTLTAATTIDQGTNNLTFAGTGRTIVNGDFQYNGKVYVTKIRVHALATPIVWASDDYIVIITNIGIAGSLALPDPVANPNRVLCISNNTGGSVAAAAYNGTKYPAGLSSCSAGSALMFVSDGANWYTMAGR